MRKFILKGFLLSIPLIIIIYIQPFYLLYHDRYKFVVAGSEVYLSIKKSKSRTNQRKVILGDSVADQLFPNTKQNNTFNSLACNQSISVLGQYLLLKNYLKAGNEIDTVFLMYSPFSFKNNLDQVYTFHYFLKPFYTSEYKKEFTELVNKQIAKIPYHFLTREPYILTSNWAPVFNSEDSSKSLFLSPISIEYLKKIKDLSIEYDFKFLIIPTPTRESFKPKIDNLYKHEKFDDDLKPEFSFYYNIINYQKDSCFIDEVHLKNPERFQEEYVQYLIPKKGNDQITEYNNEVNINNNYTHYRR